MSTTATLWRQIMGMPNSTLRDTLRCYAQEDGVSVRSVVRHGRAAVLVSGGNRGVCLDGADVPVLAAALALEN